MTTTVSTVSAAVSTASAGLTLWDAYSQRSVQLNAAELIDHKVKAAFIDFLIEADPHIKEMWIVFNTKERILK